MVFLSSLMNKSHNRDQLLDLAKGVAIVLVVIGHTLQANGRNFDNSNLFRFIYSFHMPFFVFLSGCAASFWMKKLENAQVTAQYFRSISLRIYRSSIQLMVPFLAWTLITYIIHKTNEPLNQYLLKVAKQPDYSLWFLPCIFWCIFFVCIFYTIIVVINSLLKRSYSFEWLTNLLSNPFIQLGLMLFLWTHLRIRLPNEFGLVFVNWFGGGLFFYFVLGVFFYQSIADIKSRIFRFLPYICLILLVPYWSRGGPHDLIRSAPEFIRNNKFVEYYPIVVATAGTLVFFDLAKIINSLQTYWIKRVFSWLGIASLGIYATHYFLLDVYPPIIAPLVISLVLFEFILLIPFARIILLGRLNNHEENRALNQQ